MQALAACNEARCLFTSPFCPALARKNSFNQTMSAIATSSPVLHKRCMLRSGHVIRCSFFSDAGAWTNKSWALPASLHMGDAEMGDAEMGNAEIVSYLLKKMEDEEMGDAQIVSYLLNDSGMLMHRVLTMTAIACELGWIICDLEAENKEMKAKMMTLEKNRR